MATRGDKRERRDPVDGLVLVTDTDALLELELFSLSLELRSMETFRLFVAGFFSNKRKKCSTKKKKINAYENDWKIDDVLDFSLHVFSKVIHHYHPEQVVKNTNDRLKMCNH